MTGKQMYDSFVSSLSPREFIAPYANREDPLGAAIQEIVNSWVWAPPVPDDFYSKVEEYCLELLKEQQEEERHFL
jgi:hypothetical protein